MEKIVEKGEHGEGLDIIHKFITDPNVEHEYIPKSGQRKGLHQWLNSDRMPGSVHEILKLFQDFINRYLESQTSLSPQSSF